MRRMRVALFTLLVFSWFLEKSAEANGRFPAANQLVRRPGAPDDFVLRATFGMLLTKDGGKNWDWVCEQAFGFNGVTDAPIAYSAGGSILVGTFYGAYVARKGNGCQWDLDPTIPKLQISDVTVRSDRTSTALVILSANSPNTPDYITKLYDSNDDANSFAEIHTFDKTFIANSVETGGAAGTKRVYVSGYRYNAGLYASAMFVSDDDGKTFVEYPIPTDPMKEFGVYIAGVDPTAADRVYVRTTGAAPDGNNTKHPYNRLWVSEDGGKTWKAIFTAEGSNQMAEQALLGFALSADGSKIYAGGPVHGVNVASRADFQFTKTSDVQVECLAVLDGVLWACSRTVFALGTSTDDGKNFTPLLTLNEIRGPLACPPQSSFHQNDAGGCLTVWPPIRDILKIDGGAEADAGKDGGTTGGGGCGCAAQNESATLGWGAFGILGVIVLGSMRRRRA